MPQFLVVTASHVAGKQRHDWQTLSDGGYIVIGRLADTDVSKLSRSELDRRIPAERYPNEQGALQSFERFLALDRLSETGLNRHRRRGIVVTLRALQSEDCELLRRSLQKH